MPETLADSTLYAFELANKATGETRRASIEADDFEAASDLASKMAADLVRKTGTHWFPIVIHRIERT
jgi:hypothetical protein